MRTSGDFSRREFVALSGRAGLALAVLGPAFSHEGIPAITGTAAAPEPASLYSGLRWRMLGPFRGGRVAAACGVPGRPNEFYFGAANGGVWKSIDAGRVWSPVFDAQPVASIGAVTVAPSAPDVVYVGTGECTLRDSMGYGNGVYKSTNGGESWTHLGLRCRRITSGGSPSIPGIRTSYSWRRSGNCTRRAPSGACIDRRMAARTGKRSCTRTRTSAPWRSRSIPPIRRSFMRACGPRGAPCSTPTVRRMGTVAGFSNRRMVAPPGNSSRTGSPRTVSARRPSLSHRPTRVACTQWSTACSPSRAQPSRRPRLPVADVASRRCRGKGGFFRSDDAGATWTRISADQALWGRGWYFTHVTVDPKNADVVYVPNVAVNRSKDGGKTWVPLRGSPGGDDYHQAWVSAG